MLMEYQQGFGFIGLLNIKIGIHIIVESISVSTHLSTDKMCPWHSINTDELIVMSRKLYYHVKKTILLICCSLGQALCKFWLIMVGFEGGRKQESLKLIT